jgi:hypothetical protein
VISGSEQSPFDLRPGSDEDGSGDLVRTVVTPDVAATLRSLTLVDSPCERLIFRMSVVDGDIVLAGDVDDLDELTGYVAAKANHERDRRRKKRFDAAFDALHDVVQQAQRQ